MTTSMKSQTNLWLRSKARRIIDSCFCSSTKGIQRIGDQNSGWTIQTRPPPRVAYCAGVGKGITFEVALASITSRPVLLLDPSPTGVDTVRELDRSNSLDNVEFFPVGLAARAGVVEFSVPRDPREGSYSVAHGDLEKVSFECWSLATIMDRRGDTSIDLLKMDIEGFEYDIIDQLLNDKIPVRQICVEFHPWLQPGRTLRILLRLYAAGYRIVYKHHGDYTFLRP